MKSMTQFIIKLPSQLNQQKIPLSELTDKQANKHDSSKVSVNMS